MKTQTLGLLAILSLGVGLTSFSSAGMFQESTDIGTYGESSAISGHVTVIHRDAQGSVLGYQEYDNIIINQGFSCMSEVLFATTNATCVAASATDQFDNIGLLATVPAPQREDTAASGIPRLSGNGLDPIQATTRGVDVEATGTGATQDSTIIGMQHTFTKSGVGGIVVGGAVLENTASDAVFAARAFSADLTLNENDTLEITWSITLG